jgi:hypothetical protein
MADKDETRDWKQLRSALEALETRLQKVTVDMERSMIADYVQLLNRPRSLIWRNLLAGTARGVGIAIGFTFFAATSSRSSRISWRASHIRALSDTI